MREILFKAKIKDSNELVIGYYVYVDYLDKHYILVSEKTHDGFSGMLAMKQYEVDGDTICQCTGLKDKNGKLIWENDICDRKEEYPEIVKYHDGDWTLDYSYASNSEIGFNFCNLGFYVTERNCVEVIGNIFDNPELMNE